MNEELKALVQLGLGGAAFLVVIWLMRWVFTKTIPRLSSTFAEALRDVQDRAEKREERLMGELRYQHDTLITELKDQRRELLGRGP